jgi:hypothetical protein
MKKLILLACLAGAAHASALLPVLPYTTSSTCKAHHGDWFPAQELDPVTHSSTKPLCFARPVQPISSEERVLNLQFQVQELESRLEERLHTLESKALELRSQEERLDSLESRVHELEWKLTLRQ